MQGLAKIREEKMKLDSLEPAFKTVMAVVIAETAAATGLTWVCTSARRTMAEQTALYAQGRTKPGKIVTKAPAGSSAHNFGLAADCAPMLKNGKDIWWNAPSSVWDTYGRVCEKHGMTWGGSFISIVDKPHVEDPRWKAERAKWRTGKVKIL
jgi:peptidoglycan L-alanyl-D-glutamate endopeptidase CwlK